MKKVLITSLATTMFMAVSAQHVVAEEKAESDKQENVAVTFTGTIEVEASWRSDFDESESSDINLATADFGLEAKALPWLSGTLALTWDDEEDEITVDEAYLTLGGEWGNGIPPISITAGRFYLPFGVFESNAISDPLTKEAFEIREDAVMVTYPVAGSGLELAAYVFNGDTNEGGGDDNIEHYGVKIGYSLESEGISFSTQLGYINSMLDSDTLGDVVDLEADYVGGVFVQAELSYDRFSLRGEYMTALDDYLAGTDAGDIEQTPMSYHVEAGVEFEMVKPMLVGISWSGSDDLGGVVPEDRLATFLSVELADGLSTTVEYSHENDFSVDDGGTGADADQITVQLAYEF